MKAYFQTLGDSAYPKSTEPRLRSITRFQELLVVAFREFSHITDDTIFQERKRHEKGVVISIENYAKRATIRGLTHVGRLNKDQLGKIYDHFQLALLRSSGTTGRRNSMYVPSPRDEKSEGKVEQRLGREAFRILLGDISTWARNETVVRNGFHQHLERAAVEHELIDRLFIAWDRSRVGSLSLQDVVMGLDSVMFNDLMSSIAWLFNLHDKDKDGYLTKDEVLQLSESLLVCLSSRQSFTEADSRVLHASLSSVTNQETDIWAQCRMCAFALCLLAALDQF